ERCGGYGTAQVGDLHDLDLLCIAGPPTTTQLLARYPALPLLIDRLSPDAVIVLDDADRVMETRAVRRWLAEFPGLRADRLLTKRGCVILRQQADQAAGAVSEHTGAAMPG